MYEFPLNRVAARIVPLVVLVGILALAGCSSPEASNLPTPAVVWEKGEPTGPEWNSDWADAFKKAEIQLAAADAFGDFSDPHLVAALGYDSAQAEAQSAEGIRFDPESSMRGFYERDATFAYRGTILAVDEAADGLSAVVHGCKTTLQGNVLVGDSDDWLIVRLPDGTHSAVRRGGNSHDECHDAELWVGKWATPIDFDNVGRDKVKMPLPRDYYVKLGVISK